LIIRKISGILRRVRDDEADIAQGSYGLPAARPLIREMTRLAEAGDYRGAFRCAFLATLSYLDETGAIRFERSRTNWEYLRQLKRGGHDSLHDDLNRLASAFDRKFYGSEPCTEDDYHSALAVYKRISSQEAAA